MPPIFAPLTPPKNRPPPPQNLRPSPAPTDAAPRPFSLKNRSAILAVGVAIIASCGAIIGASIRQETQRAARTGQSAFSTFSSTQVIGAEVSAAERGEASPLPAVEDGKGGDAGDLKEDRKLLAQQIQALEGRRAGLVQQRLITEKKMEGLRERQREKIEREKEADAEQTRPFKKYGS